MRQALGSFCNIEKGSPVKIYFLSVDDLATNSSLSVQALYVYLYPAGSACQSRHLILFSPSPPSLHSTSSTHHHTLVNAPPPFSTLLFHHQPFLSFATFLSFNGACYATFTFSGYLRSILFYASAIRSWAYHGFASMSFATEILRKETQLTPGNVSFVSNMTSQLHLETHLTSENPSRDTIHFG